MLYLASMLLLCLQFNTLQQNVRAITFPIILSADLYNQQKYYSVISFIRYSNKRITAQADVFYNQISQENVLIKTKIIRAYAHTLTCIREQIYIDKENL